MTWRPFALAGGCYEDDTLPWSSQDTVNWIPVMAEVEGTRTPVMLRGVPGLSPTAANGDAFSAFDSSGARRSGIVFRGAYNADGVFLLVQGTTCYRYNGDWKAPTVVGTVPGVGRVTFAHNQITGGSQIVIANGTAGYVYNTVDGTFAQITDEAFPGAKSVDYIDSYIVAAEPGGRYWFTSDLADATSYNALNRYEAESAPDKIVGLIVSHNEVIVFGERTMEFYYDSGADTITFQRRSGTQTEVGAASQHAIAKLDNTVYWLGNDGIVYMLNGYTPVRISKHPIEQQIERVDISKCFALVYEDRGHKIVYFTFPDGLTWGYDVSTQVWHRRKSYGLKRWRANTLTKWGTKWYAGDYTNGSLCTVDWGVNTENFAPLVAERRAAVVQAEMNRFRLNAVELSVDSQKSISVIPKMSVSGDLPNGIIGDSGTMQYVIKNALGAVTIKLVGSLPPGATMDAAGLVTYAYSTGGHYAWTVVATDSTGRVASLEDSADVRLQQWWATVPGSNTLYYSDDLATWNTTTRTPNVSPSAKMAPLSTGIGRALIFSDTSTGDEIVADFTAPVATTLGVAAFNPDVAQYYPDIDAIVALVYGDVTLGRGAANVRISTDGGLTFQSYALPGPGAVGITRLDSGRWLIVDGPNAGSSFIRYTDSQLPVGGWITGPPLTSGVNAYSAIASNGSKAVVLDNGGRSFSTTDGAAFAQSTTPVSHQSTLYNGCAAHGVTYVFSTGNNPSGNILRSPDSGATWTLVTAPCSSAPRVMRYGKGAFVLSLTANKPVMSVDDGMTWTTIDALPLGAQVGLVEWVP